MSTSSKRPAGELPEDTPPVTRQKQDMSHSFEVPDNLQVDDATHSRMDDEILQGFPAPPTTAAIAATLLSTIVSFSDGRLEPKYKDIREAKALLAKHPALKELLQEAWTSKTFRVIRNLRE